MADLRLAEIAPEASPFQDKKIAEIATVAKDRFLRQGDLDGAADALRLIVFAKSALLEDAVPTARDGVSLLANAHGGCTQRAEAKMLLAFAEAVERSQVQVSEAIEAAQKAHDYFTSLGDERLRVEVCTTLAQLHLSRGEGKDLELAKKSAELAVGISETMQDRCRGRALLARGAVAFPKWQPYAEKALELAIDSEDLPLEVEVRLSMARWWARMEEHERSLAEAKEVLDLLQEQGAGCHRQMAATQLACSALVEIGKPEKGCRTSTGEAHFAKALRLSKDLLRLAEMDTSQVIHMLAAMHLIQVQIACSEPSEAVETGKATLKWCLQRQSGRDYYSEGQILEKMLKAYTQIIPNTSQKEEMEHACGLSMTIIQHLVSGEAFCQAVDLMSQVLKSFTALGRPLEAWAAASQLRELLRGSPGNSEAPLVVAMAAAVQAAGRLEESCKLAQEAARLFEDQADDRQAAMALSLVAKAQLTMGKYSASRQNGRRARRRLAEIGDCEEEIRMRLVVARACSAKDERGIKQTKDAVREAQEATKLAVDLAKQDLVVESFATYVEVLLEAGQLEICCQAADELMRLEVPAKDQVGVLVHAAKAQEKLGNVLAAKAYAERVAELAPKVANEGCGELLREAREMIATAYRSEPNIRSSPAVKAGFFTKHKEESAPNIGLKLRIKELTGTVLGLNSEDVEGDIPLKDIGLSSGVAVILRDELQNDVKGIRLPPTLFLDYPTVDAVVGYVTGKLR
eukprot:Skav208806  [mRNA]  locus=scaffold349:123937:126257:+ [translate_table: standard]